MGYKSYIYLPVWRFFNFSLIKTTKINERVNLEFRAQVLNAFNLTNFQPNNGTNTSIGSRVWTDDGGLSGYSRDSGSGRPDSGVGVPAELLIGCW